MQRLLTFPSQLTLEWAHNRTPAFMRPSMVPYAVSLEGALSAAECENIIRTMERIEPHESDGCDAITRETRGHAVLDPIEWVARNVNKRYFEFDLDEGGHAWMQTYERGNKYQRHMDGSPGQTRKLTAVAMLTDPDEYRGGALDIFVKPQSFTVPRTQGTIVVFQHWLEHEVAPVTSGKRQTINMGFWGPPFR